MPELPEVETIKNTLLPIVKDRRVLKVEVFRKSIVKNLENEFKEFMNNAKFLNISRRGKYLIFHLSDHKILVSHLGMEGKYYELAENEADSKYCRVAFHLDNNKKLCYDDSRCFGKMFMAYDHNYLKIKELAKLGPEPFEITNVDFLLEKSQKVNVPIKTALLSQKLFVGLGNIYADEVLFLSKIHPLTPTRNISKNEWELIVKNTKTVLKQAIAAGGSTVKSYESGKGISGNFQNKLRVYGQKGKKCVSCHRILRFIKVNGRGTTYCPSCQKKNVAPLKIAIVGKIASGKSAVLNIFKTNQFCTISSDDVVHSLYSQKNIQDKIIKKLKIKEKNMNIFIDGLRNHLHDNPKDLEKLEKLIHPLVKDVIVKTFNNSNSILLVAEVPLLYKANMQNMFDIIIGVDINEKNQINRLKLRDREKSDFNKHINDNNNLFDERLADLDYIINNDGDLSSLIRQTEEIISKVLNRLDQSLDRA
ncbi:MAG TPA: bifunctional DNA-formamidopyrimidine glycosylase/DNA-(apurinic or apyrimidinic site) lyase [Erysipelotrichaceae bacterium]|nr:bifunctional DNA-formamidopyrimidine glycosylase/DNA-(apurinic or apyrimidinic site) lyase [Erysipelotrichaceae bacterium]